MTPQSPIMLVAPVVPGREDGVRRLLASMTRRSGVADPQNRLLPFGRITTLHFARFVLVDDALQADLRLHDIARPPRLPTCLLFMADCDGDARGTLQRIAEVGDPGLRELFAHCEGFGPGTDLLAWMLDHDRPVDVFYVNFRGRTVRQIQEEQQLFEALSARVPREPMSDAAQARAARQALVDHVRAEQRAQRLPLTPEAPTPAAWRLMEGLHAAMGVLLVLLAVLLLPLTLLAAIPVIALLRWRETHDPEYCPRPDDAAVQSLQKDEDWDLTNQFSAIGAVKPGRFRRWLLIVILAAIDYAARHVFNRGFLGRVRTIHFARWVFLDDKTRVAFASNYDGSHEAYMDDFINKVGWGLNLSFSNGVGWPRTAWLLFQGCRHEQRFKRYQRRHQVRTQVWFKAYPGLTLTDMERNHRVRLGLEARSPRDDEVMAWLRLL